MKTNSGLDVPIFIGAQVKVSAFCPFYHTFPVKRGRLLEVLGDGVGKLYRVELNSGEEVYFRRAEIEPVYPESSLLALNWDGNKSNSSLT